jgi:hypothetical protein
LQVFWEFDENVLYASATSAHGHSQYHLIVESLPNQDVWDWTVWDGGPIVSHGDAPSVLNAMREAQRAVRQWDDMWRAGQ